MPYPRLLSKPAQSFFLFGPRGTGKSTWLDQVLPEAVRLDLLDTSLALELTREPHRLEAVIGDPPPRRWVVIDEIQKIPSLLDEVHRLIEKRKWPFALSGSSARKLKRGGANLLASRALRRRLEGLTFAELGTDWDLDHALAWGSLPQVWNSRSDAAEILDAYFHNYLKEEIREEGIVRQYPPFLRFLAIAGQLNGQVVNASNISRDAMVPRSSVDGYFSILSDTLLGHFLPAYQPRLKVRERAHPKFYWFDPGVARAAGGRLFTAPEPSLQGFALEAWIYHELRVYNETARRHRPMFYYHTTGQNEIDFVIESAPAQAHQPPRVVCIEVKHAERWNSSWEKPIRALRALSDIHVDRMVGVYRGARVLRSEGFEVFPVAEFLKRLHQGDFF